jgi:acetyl-CoA C-acetyltransferase
MRDQSFRGDGSMNTREIYVVAAARTAIGTFGGALKDVPLSQLATTAVREALKRSGAEAATIGHVVMGNVIPTDTRDAYLARVAASRPASRTRRRR